MSKLREAFEKGEFAITAEMAPPKGTDLSHLAECAKLVDVYKRQIQKYFVT